MRLLHLFGMVEKPSGVFAHIAGGGDKFIQQRPFLCWRFLTVLGCHLLKHFASGLITQRLFHAPLLWKRAVGDRFVEATDYSPLLAS